MSWFTNLFASGASKLVDSVGNAIDNLVTSDEEREQLKNELTKEVNSFKKVQLGHVETLEQQITDRHKIDMQSDSWLSKNVRPVMLVFMTVATVVLSYLTVFTELTQLQIDTLNGWLPLLQTLLITAYSFYFGSRGFEKYKQMKSVK